MLVLNQGRTLGPGDLSINVRDGEGAPIIPTSITYTIFSVDDQGNRTLASPPRLIPQSSMPGSYYITGVVPTVWMGRLDLVWYLQQYPGDTERQVFEEFEVVRIDPTTSSFEAPSVLMAARPGMTPKIAKMVMTVRELLGDTNPDRNYHFSPPTTGKVVSNFNSRVGFLWIDPTIVVMLNVAVSLMNTANPLGLTEYTINSIPTDWWQIGTLGAASLCLSSKAAIWTEEEFGYSLNGVSLDINKAQNYASLAAAYKTAFDAALPALTANRPASVGLRQQRWLLG